MADDVSAACRDWLGLEPTDLPFPHRVLGVSPDESDPLVIVRAADGRFEVLRGVAQDRGAERDALVAQVEAARDVMIAAAMATRGRPVAPPPVPPSLPVAPPPPVPPVPPPVPPAGWQRDEGPTGDIGSLPVRRRPVPVRHRDSGVTALVVSALVLGVAALVAYGAWPLLRDSLHRAPRRVAANRPAPQREAPREPAAVEPPRSKPKPKPKPAAGREPPAALEAGPESEPNPEPQPRDTPDLPPAEPDASPLASAAPPESESPPAPQAVDVDAVRADVDAAIVKALAALRTHDYGMARRTLAAILDRALNDQQSTDRVQRWQHLVTYAEAFPKYRDQALASAASTTATYEIGDRQIGVVELTNDQFIYRDSRRPGRNLHAPRDAIPAEIEMGLVRAWFAADGRPANHLFLGAAALAQRESDLDTARREWQAADDGGEPHGRPLLELLEDPALRGP